MSMFSNITDEIRTLVHQWEATLSALTHHYVSTPRNKQHRNIKQIIGHMVDSASNNTHRIIHLQYQDSPVLYPDYANQGNNDKWIAIQQYSYEDWDVLLQLWKYVNLHICHVIECIDEARLNHVWVSAIGKEITLKAMVEDFPRHFKLHVAEIEELIK